MLINRSKLSASVFLLATSLFCWFILVSPPREQHSVGENAKLHATLLKQIQQLQRELELANTGAAHIASTPPPFTASDPSLAQSAAKADQSRHSFSYVFYATSDPYACSVLVNIHRLHVLKSSLPVHVLVSSDVSNVYLESIKNAYATIHVIEEVPPLFMNGGGYYQGCLLKLLAFQMHEIVPELERVLVLDGDQLIMKNLDLLFTGLPVVDLAAPRAYWHSKDYLASTFMMISLSDRLWRTVKGTMRTIREKEYDMELINKLFGETSMVLSGEYVALNSHWEDWNLPSWFHPSSRLNLTTIDVINKLSKHKTGPGNRKREEQGVSNDGLDRLTSARDNNAVHTVTDVSAPATDSSSPEPTTSHAQNFTAMSSASHLLPSPEPRFPKSHPLTEELYRLQDAAAVIHFSALGKPWEHTNMTVGFMRPDAHPIFVEQFEIWRQTADKVCPGGTHTLLGSK